MSGGDELYCKRFLGNGLLRPLSLTSINRYSIGEVSLNIPFLVPPSPCVCLCDRVGYGVS